MKQLVHLRCLLLFLSWLLFSLIAQAQTPAWQSAQALVATSASNSANAAVTAQATDAAGNLYLAGTFNDVLQLGTTTLTSTSSAFGFIAKYSRTSNRFIWAQVLSGNSVQAMVVSGTSIYVAGEYTGSVSFGSTTLAPFSSALNSFDMFVTKLTDTGSSANYAWAQRAGGASDDYVLALAVSGTSVFLTGSFNSATAQFGNTTLTNAKVGLPATSDAFVAKLTDAGSASSYAWAQRAGGLADDFAYGLAVSGTSVYVAGSASGIANFSGFTITSAGLSDAFVAKLTDAGNTSSYTWVQQIGGANDDYARALALGSTGLYVTGSFASASVSLGITTLTNTATGTQDCFIGKLADAGSTSNYAWAQRLGGSNDDAPTTIATQGNSVYLAGVFNGLPVGSSGGGSCTVGSTVLASAGKADIFITRLLDTGISGNYVWAQRAGGTNDDIPFVLSLDGTGVYTAGYSFSTSASFGAFTLANPSGAGTGTMGFLASLTDIVLPTRDAALQASLSLYPNPAHGTASVRVPLGPATLTLLDALGRTVGTHTAPAGQNYPLDLTGLAPGVYALRVQAGEAVATQKLVVE